MLIQDTPDTLFVWCKQTSKVELFNPNTYCGFYSSRLCKVDKWLCQLNAVMLNAVSVSVKPSRIPNNCSAWTKKLSHRQQNLVYMGVLLFLRTNFPGFWEEMPCFQCSKDLKSSRLCTHPNKSDLFWKTRELFYCPSCFLSWSKLLLVMSLVIMWHWFLSLN